MKKYYFFLLTFFLVAMCANADVTVCENQPDENGNYSSPYIKKGTVTWNDNTKTLTLDNAVIEYSSDTPYDFFRPVYVTEDATIVIHGECKLITNGFVALSFESYNVKNVTLTGDGSLSTTSRWIDIFLKCTQLTIKDIDIETVNGIAENGNAVWCGLAFDNVHATIKGRVGRIGLGITFNNCAITYPLDAYIAETEGYGYAIYCGNNDIPEKIIISRGGNIKGDVNGDGEVNIADVNALIDAILRDNHNMRCDVNGDHEVNIADVNALIDIILNPVVAEDHEWVDLGLPSGTLWATCNVGANAPEGYGDYFAWGETAPKELYYADTYKWGHNDSNGNWMMSKYCTNSSYGTVDNKTELELADDAAYVNWGSSWRMPTLEQWQELLSNCSWKWTIINGVNGQQGTGPNGNTVFLPATGSRSLAPSQVGMNGHYWSRTLDIDNSSAADGLYFSSGGLSWYRSAREFGFTVRAVRASQN